MWKEGSVYRWIFLLFCFIIIICLFFGGSCLRKNEADELRGEIKQLKEMINDKKIKGGKKMKESKISCCPLAEVKLEDLVPIAIVITAGCEKCTQKFINNAIANGCSKEQVKEIVSIVDSIHQLDCFQKAVGQEIVNRMKKPLEVAKEILEKNQ